MFKIGDVVIAKRPASRMSHPWVCWVPGMDVYDGASIEVKYVGDGYIMSRGCVFVNEWLSAPNKFKGNIK